MRRIGLAIVLILSLVLVPLGVEAQQSTRIPTIGFLGASTPAAMRDWVAAFVGGLDELGFAGAGDPVAAGLVASLARPGGNVTGLSIQQTDAAHKRLDLLREFVPRLGRLAIVANVDSRSAELDMMEIRDIASALGLHASTIEIRGGERIVPAMEALRGKADALYVVTDPLLFANRSRINALATEMRLPTMCSYREYVAAGCFMSYGPSLGGNFRRAATYVDKILKGAKPGDIPVEQPTKFELVINLKTAKALGLTIPQSVLGRADQVIE